LNSIEFGGVLLSCMGRRMFARGADGPLKPNGPPRRTSRRHPYKTPNTNRRADSTALLGRASYTVIMVFI
jgi:hypothetical protein